MLHNRPPLKIYYSRANAGGFALAFVAFTALPVFLLILPPSDTDTMYSWVGNEPFKTLLASLLIAWCVAGFLLCLYWMLTPLPLLVVDEYGLVYQGHPLVQRTIVWADVDTIFAFYYRDWRSASLTLEFHLKPYAVAAYGNKPRVKLGISPFLLPMHTEELVGRLRGYHAVDYHVLGG
jgi:hypothetical protein